MKKNLVFILLTLAALASCASSALAGGILKTDTVNWIWQTNLGVGGTTGLKGLIASASDTTAWVSTKDWYIPDLNAPTADSLVVARFIIAVDSSAAYAPGQNTCTVIVQGAATPGANVVTLGTYALKPTTGQAFISVPLRISTTKVVNLESLSGWAHLPPLLRIKVDNSANMLAARCFVQYLRAVPN